MDHMQQTLGLVTLVVNEYEPAIEYYVNKLGFNLVEDTPLPDEDKRWVVVEPAGSTGCQLLLARGNSKQQASHIGNQTGGRVAFFLYTNDLWRDYRAYCDKNVTFVRGPREEPYGTVAVFKDLYGNLWDLIEPSTPLNKSTPSDR